MNEREELERLRKVKRLRELEAKAAGQVGVTPAPSASDIVNSFNEGNPYAPSPEELAAEDARLAQPKQGNAVSRFFGGVAEGLEGFAGSRVVPRQPGTENAPVALTDVPDALARSPAAIAGGAARLAEGLTSRPGETIRDAAYQAVTAPNRAAESYTEANRALVAGDYGEAGRQGVNAATGLAETALMVAAPGAGGARRAAARPQILDDAARAGVDVNAPMAFPRSAGAASKQLAENIPAGITTRKAADRSLTQLEGAVSRMADEYSPGATSLDAGATAREGAARFNRRSDITPDESVTLRRPARFSTFRDKAEAAYSRAYRGFDAETQAPATVTAERLREVNSRFTNEQLADLFSLPVARRLDGIIQGGELSIADMRSLRTEVREIQNGGRALRTRDDAALERLEGALTEDIYAAVEHAGGEAALRNLRRADQYYRRGVERIRRALQPFLKDGATDESAARTILNAAQGKPGRGDIQRLRALRRTLRPDELDDVSSGVLREMGQPKPGADWSPETFSRNWDNLGDDAKAVLFDRAQRPEVRENLDALARMIDRQRNVEALSNRARSGANAQNFGTAVAFMADPVTTTFAVLGANAGGRLLMSPAFTRAMLQIQRNAPRATQEGANFVAERARVVAILSSAENADSSIRPYTAVLKQALEEAENDNQAVQRQTAGQQ